MEFYLVSAYRPLSTTWIHQRRAISLGVKNKLKSYAHACLIYAKTHPHLVVSACARSRPRRGASHYGHPSAVNWSPPTKRPHITYRVRTMCTASKLTSNPSASTGYSDPALYRQVSFCTFCSRVSRLYVRHYHEKSVASLAPACRGIHHRRLLESVIHTAALMLTPSCSWCPEVMAGHVARVSCGPSRLQITHVSRPVAASRMCVSESDDCSCSKCN